jgi:outer membrane immunogenic protein
MMKYRIVAATALASLVAVPASAGAIIFEPAPEPQVTVAPAPPPPAPRPVWTGPYVGAQVGWGRLELDSPAFDVNDDDDFGIAQVEFGEAFSIRDSGIVYGAHLGYDFGFANGFVVGAEVAYNRLNADPSVDLEFFGDPLGTLTFDAKHLVRLTARAGYSFGNTLVYAKGGGAWLRGTTRFRGFEDFSERNSDRGWVAGGGVEHLITTNVSAGVEALFHRFRDFDDTDFDIDLTTIQARISYRF